MNKYTIVGIAYVAVILVNLALLAGVVLAGAVWVVVKVLQWTGVIQ